MRRRSAAASSLILCCFCAAAAEELPKTPVYVNSNANDFYAKQLVYHVKELLRGSNSMTAATSAEDAAYHINLAALDAVGCEGVVYSAAWVWWPPKKAALYQGQKVGTCGIDRLSSCAVSIVASTAENIENDAKFLSDMLKKELTVPKD